MTAAQGAEGDVEREAAYYREVEEFFVSRRGDPLFLSNADWLLIRRWRRSGLPLRVVLRGIGDALDAHARSWGRRRKVGSLQYCAAEVEQAGERWGSAVPGEGDADATPGLEALRQAAAGAEGLGPKSRVAVAALQERLEPGAETTAELERWLGGVEKELVECLRLETDRETLARAESEVDGELAPYRHRMPERVAQQIRRDALARKLLALHGLPRLTLFP